MVRNNLPGLYFYDETPVPRKELFDQGNIPRACVKYLLTESHFLFVLSSDPIESFFGWLRRPAGSNDQTDARAVQSGI